MGKTLSYRTHRIKQLLSRALLLNLIFLVAVNIKAFSGKREEKGIHVPLRSKFQRDFHRSQIAIAFAQILCPFVRRV